MTKFRWAGAMALAGLTLCAPRAAEAQETISCPLGYCSKQVQAIDDGTGHVASVSRANPLPIDGVVRGSSTDRGASVGASAVTLMAANTARRGFSIQNQSTTSDCYISGQAGATADWHSLKIAAGAYYETPATHVGTAAISIVCTQAATPVYAREW